MALREKLSDRVTPYLQPGEEVQQTFIAQAGGNPWFVNMLGALGQALVKRRIVAVTNQGIIVLAASFSGTKPTEVLHRLPRATKLGPTKGVWSAISPAGEKMYVHARFRKDIEAADAGLPATA